MVGAGPFDELLAGQQSHALTEDRLVYGTFHLCAEGNLNRHDDDQMAELKKMYDWYERSQFARKRRDASSHSGAGTTMRPNTVRMGLSSRRTRPALHPLK